MALKPSLYKFSGQHVYLWNLKKGNGTVMSRWLGCQEVLTKMEDHARCEYGPHSIGFATLLTPEDILLENFVYPLIGQNSET